MIKGLRDAGGNHAVNAAQSVAGAEPADRGRHRRDQVNNDRTAQIKQEIVAADPAKLSEPEWAFVDSLPGCDLDGQ